MIGTIRHRPLDALVVALAAVQQVEIWVGEVPGPKVAVVVASLLWTLPLLLRRRYPFAAPAFVFAVAGLASIAFPPAFGGYATVAAGQFLAFWVVGEQEKPSDVLAGIAIGIASIAVSAQWDERLDAADAITFSIAGSGVALVAHALRRRERSARELEQRAARLEQEQGNLERDAVVAERTRIARELHDVIAHSLSVMTVQAGAARLLLDETPERAREPLVSIEETGRQALAEMRRLLGILRDDGVEPFVAPPVEKA